MADSASRIYRIEKEMYASQWPSQGALYGEGRWNTKSFWVIYCSESVALAKLEILANSIYLPTDRILLTIQISAQAPVYDLPLADTPKDWMKVPYPKSLHQITRDILESQSYVALHVPSRQSPTERNILLYPPHPQFSQWVQVVDRQVITFDPRLKPIS